MKKVRIHIEWKTSGGSVSSTTYCDQLIDEATLNNASLMRMYCENLLSKNYVSFSSIYRVMIDGGCQFHY